MRIDKRGDKKKKPPECGLSVSVKLRQVASTTLAAAFSAKNQKLSKLRSVTLISARAIFSENLAIE
jgi:hypothetical protein